MVKSNEGESFLFDKHGNVRAIIPAGKIAIPEQGTKALTIKEESSDFCKTA